MTTRETDLKRLPVVLEKEVKRQKKLSEGIGREVDNLIDKLHEVKGLLKSGKMIPKDALNELKEFAVKTEHETGLQSDEKLKYLSDVIEDISDCFSSSSLYHVLDDSGEPWQNRKKLILNVVGEHLYHTGRILAGQMLEKEANITIDESYKVKYESLRIITSTIKNRESSQLHAWLLQAKAEWKAHWNEETPSPKISEHVNDLEFRIYRLHIIGLLKKGNKEEAFSYIKKHLPIYAKTKWHKEIARLVGALVFITKDGKVSDVNPYDFLTDDNTDLWEDLCDSFRDCWCVNSEAPQKPHLSTCLEAGLQALPTLQKYLSLPESFRKTKELHAPALSNNLIFRSSLSCPVTQQVTTCGSGSNPAMLLPCCHVLSRSAIDSLVRPPNNILKCPYCPNECKHSGCQPLFI